jgi:serine/threonine protein kinase
VEVVGHLSRGCELDVYEVWEERRACPSVAKLLMPAARANHAAAARLRREGTLLERLAHPYLVRAYETVESSRGPIVVLETLEGETLRHTIDRRRRRMPEVDLIWVGLHLCSVLHYLHGECLLHLDLKPSNIINRYGRATVIDLNLARGPGLIPRGAGTAEYLSPEQARGDEVSPASDVWGVGAVLFAAATATRPFSSRRDRVFEQLHRPAVPVRSLRRLDSGLADAIDQCLSLEPEARPTVPELTELLSNLLDDESQPLAQSLSA